MSKPKIATVWLEACAGCHMSFLDIDERIVDLLDKVELTATPMTDFKEIPQAKELQSGQVGYEHVGVYVPHLETSVESLVKGFGCTLASMPANQNRVAFVRGPENLMLELIEA